MSAFDGTLGSGFGPAFAAAVAPEFERLQVSQAVRAAADARDKLHHAEAAGPAASLGSSGTPVTEDDEAFARRIVRLRRAAQELGHNAAIVQGLRVVPALVTAPVPGRHAGVDVVDAETALRRARVALQQFDRDQAPASGRNGSTYRVGHDGELDEMSGEEVAAYRVQLVAAVEAADIAHGAAQMATIVGIR